MDCDCDDGDEGTKDEKPEASIAQAATNEEEDVAA